MYVYVCLWIWLCGCEIMWLGVHVDVGVGPSGKAVKPFPRFRVMETSRKRRGHDSSDWRGGPQKVCRPWRPSRARVREADTRGCEGIGRGWASHPASPSAAVVSAGSGSGGESKAVVSEDQANAMTV
jgi:hypothetical protein